MQSHTSNTNISLCAITCHQNIISQKSYKIFCITAHHQVVSVLYIIKIFNFVLLPIYEILKYTCQIHVGLYRIRLLTAIRGEDLSPIC
jgi:hypothetical protein